MNKKLRQVSSALLATVFIAWTGTAKAQQGPVGQGFNEAGRAVKRGFQTAGQAVSGGFQKTRTTVHNMEVVSRVYSRLHWDKALTSSNMEIEVQAGGIAILTGVVPSEEAKTKALTLTSETVGVNPGRRPVDHRGRHQAGPRRPRHRSNHRGPADLIVDDHRHPAPFDARSPSESDIPL